MESYDVIIVGAGVAGLSTAYHLGVRGRDSVVVLEKEAVPGAGASGKSAGMLHHYHPEKEMRDVLEHAVRRLKTYHFREREEICRDVPSLWLFPEETVTRLRKDEAHRGKWETVAGDSVPAVLKPEESVGPHCWVSYPDDGLIHPDRLVSGLVEDLREMEIEVRTSHRVTSGERRSSIWLVETGKETFEGRYMVDAAGVWAEPIGRRVGVDPPELVPESRHLFFVEEEMLSEVPFGYFWDRVHDVYFRSMTEGTLISVCESIPSPPGEVPEGIEPERLLAERLLSAYPQFRDLEIKNDWCGQRTFSPDRLPVVREDPDQPGLIWSAGLGGHGLTASMWIGCRTADLIREKDG